MSDTVPSGSLPPMPAGFTLPFYYGTFTNIGIDYLVPPAAVRTLLSTAPTKEQLSAAVFDGQACLSINYQLYFAQFASAALAVQEIELNVIAFPTEEAALTPVLTYEEYATAADSTRKLGFCRMHVPCDNDLAISAGKAHFNEPKFKTAFAVTLPVPNTTTADPSAIDKWSVSCGKWDGAAGPVTSFTPENTYFSFTADLRGLTPRPVSTAPLTEYGSRIQQEEAADVAKALAAPLNVFSPYQWYDLKGTTGKVTLTPGTGASYDKVKDFIGLLQGHSPVGAWVYQSPPVAAQNRPYWVRA